MLYLLRNNFKRTFLPSLEHSHFSEAPQKFTLNQTLSQLQSQLKVPRHVETFIGDDLVEGGGGFLVVTRKCFFS